MKSFKKLAKCGMSTLVNHNALVLAKFDEGKYNLPKYQKKVMEQMTMYGDDDDEDDEEDDERSYLSVNLERPWGKGPKPKLSSKEIENVQDGTLISNKF